MSDSSINPLDYEMYDPEPTPIDYAIKDLPNHQSFSDDKAPKTYSAAVAFVYKLQRWRTDMILKQTETLPYTISPTEKWTDACILDDKPSHARHRLFTNDQLKSGPVATIVLTMEATVRAGKNYRTQTYKGTLQLSSSPARPVFIKVYQESLAELPTEFIEDQFVDG
ncbi:hypothetical protein HGRIS_003584 [Hohenbuehelia grisea]|uniref:Uncharacterized protein n=1 Tax=Hohenbuehelia grisea TaxID=104357 RepID=A0ABR3JFT0_9AGAR